MTDEEGSLFPLTCFCRKEEKNEASAQTFFVDDGIIFHFIAF